MKRPEGPPGRPIVDHLLSEQGVGRRNPAITVHDSGPPQAGVPVRGTRTSCRPKPPQRPAVARADSDHPRQMGSFSESSGNTQADGGSGRAEPVRASRTGEHSVDWGERATAPDGLHAAVGGGIAADDVVRPTDDDARDMAPRPPRETATTRVGLYAVGDVAEGRAAGRVAARGSAVDDAPADVSRDAGDAGEQGDQQVRWGRVHRGSHGRSVCGGSQAGCLRRAGGGGPRG